MKHIFRNYDIRGIYNKDLNDELAFKIAYAFGSIIKKEIENNSLLSDKIFIGFDGRLSSENIKDAIINGLMKSGIKNIVNIGLVATPVLYYITSKTKSSGIMITGSHNPKDYNGMKIVKYGIPFFNEEIQELYNFISSTEIEKYHNSFSVEVDKSVLEEYTSNLFSELEISKDIKVIFDSANGATGNIINSICDKYLKNSIATFTEIDGNFPNHHADPSDKKNLSNLISNLSKYSSNIGIMFDGDGDRVAFISKNSILSNEEMIFIFAKNILLSPNKNKNIVLDIKCSNFLVSELEKIGAKVFVTKTGHPYIKNKIRELDAIFGAELSGHIFFNDKYNGFDDGLYSAMRMIEILSKTEKSLDNLKDEFIKIYGGEEIKIECSDFKKFEVIEKIKNKFKEEGKSFIDIDGIKYIDAKGSFLIRASNTTPNLILICNSKSADNLEYLYEYTNSLLKEYL